MVQAISATEAEAVIEAEVLPAEVDEVMPLPAGESLSLEGAFSLAGQEPSRFVVILGNNDSGKTTLAASLYQMFLNQCGVGKFFFAGSQTLVAFENRSLYTLTTSYNPKPDTPRTPQGVRDVLHLKLYEQKRRREINLLLSDFSGEEYRLAIGDPQTAKEDFPQVLEARCIVLLVDGNKLAAAKGRAAEIHRSVHMLKTFYDADLIDNNAQILVTISKYDLLVSLPADEQSRIDAMLKAEIDDHFPKLTSRIWFFKTAAMPRNDEHLKPYYGLPELLDRLLANIKRPTEEFSAAQTESQFDLWAERMGI